MDCSGECKPLGPPPVVMTTIGASGTDPFPMIDRVWDIFSGKGIRTTFVTIGNSSSSAADLDIAESLGCPIHPISLNEKEENEWKEVLAILKERKREGSNSTYPFSDGAQAKWILPKNVRAVDRLPWWGEGTLSFGDSKVSTSPAGKVIQSICENMKLKDGIVRLDIVKVDTRAVAPGFERAIIPAILDAGFRPAIILVAWSSQPDIDLSVTTAAGHLQNCGYRLLGKVGTKFLYYFTDNDMYQICSWETTECANPMLNEIVRTATYQIHYSPEKEKKDDSH